ncbi:DUF5689 domain-containing protein [Polaribacter sp.]|uniref:DUF5689 domain-containing protein n=1 Tax=Polaribacter sp. TaxID=1920175 RepID=UPI003EF61DFF
MKTYKTIIFQLLFFASITFFSCIEDNDFTAPQNLGTEENAGLNAVLDSIANGSLQLKTIQQIKDLHTAGNEPLKLVSDIVVKGYVISSDKTGNFYQEFYMQDAPENPTAGIKIILSLNDNYNKYNVGRELYIRLKDLYLGETNSGDGVTTIGGRIKPVDTREVDNISTNQIRNHLFRAAKTETIVPKIVPLGGITDADISTFIKIENAFFASNVAGKSYVDPNVDFDTHRKIEGCQGFGLADVLLETSSFTSFANETIPSGGGSLSAVVSKDFGGDFTVLVLNSTDDVHMDGEKCTPLEITDFTTILLEEDFETTSGTINITDWINFSEAGTEPWESYFDTNSSSTAARVGSFRSGDTSTISWLITKGINLENTAQEFLSFETSSSFGDGSELEVLISTDWDGTTANIGSATWSSLPANIVSDSADFNLFYHSSYIDLSNYSGNAYIAFKYTGSGDEDFDGTFQLDNIIINAK